VPVFDVRARFGLVPRGVQMTDHLAIVRTARQTLALLVDAPAEVTTALSAGITPANPGLSSMPSLHSFAHLAGDIVCIHDLERFLSSADETALEAALTRVAGPPAANPPPDAPFLPAPAQ
jgi:chemotaxis signal transduction protein